MANDTPIAASRFGISVDGVQIASFSELQGITSRGGILPKGQKLLAHELTHVVQQYIGKRDILIRLKGPGSGLENLRKLRSSAGKEIKLTAYNERGAATLTVKGMVGRVETDAMQQEWTLTYETIQRVL